MVAFLASLVFIAVLLVLACVALDLLPRGKVVDIHKKYVFITGCDSGFGKKTAVALDKLGFRVFASCLTKEGEEGLRASCSERLRTLRLDVTKSAEIRAAFDEVKEQIREAGGLWGLVNNAGIARTGPLEWMTLEAFKRTADVNLFGLIDVTQTFLPLVKNSRGRVVNMASVLARVVPPYVSAYSVSKFGVEAFSDALRRELAPWGVQVSIIEPGLFKTDLSLNVEADYRALWENLSSDLKQEYGERYLEQRIRGAVQLQNSASPDTHKVVEAVLDALTSRRPRTRYLVGSDTVLLVLLSVLPTRISDFIFHRLFKLRKP